MTATAILASVLPIVKKIASHAWIDHKEKVSARASLRSAWREYQVDLLNATLREIASGKVPYSPEIHRDHNHKSTVRIDLMDQKPKKETDAKND
jgi:hypothetical protein